MAMPFKVPDEIKEKIRDVTYLFNIFDSAVCICSFRGLSDIRLSDSIQKKRSLLVLFEMIAMLEFPCGTGYQS